MTLTPSVHVPVPKASAVLEGLPNGGNTPMKEFRGVEEGFLGRLGELCWFLFGA